MSNRRHSNYYGGDRDRRDDRYYDRGSGRDRDRDGRYRRSASKGRYRDDSRDRRGKGRSSGRDGWQKEAGEIFALYAMPVIKKEGSKLLQSQVKKFMAQRKAEGKS
jgi:hypothetical protein